MTKGATDDDHWGFILVVAAVCLIVVGMIYLGPVRDKVAALGYEADSFGLRYLAVIVIGSMVGLAELLLKYRDEPMDALFDLAGGTFVLLNGAFAALALFLVEYFGAQSPLVAPKGPDGKPVQVSDTVVRVLLTGLGAMVVLRGKLLTVPGLNNTTIEIGFAPLVESVLSAVNRTIDRKRAITRLTLVAPLAREMAPLTFAKVAPHLRTGLQALQTLEKERQESVLANIKRLEEDTKSGDVAKLEAAGYDLLNNFGDACFRKLFEEAKKSAEVA
jgi:hypothetical protein